MPRHLSSSRVQGSLNRNPVVERGCFTILKGHNSYITILNVCNHYPETKNAPDIDVTDNGDLQPHISGSRPVSGSTLKHNGEQMGSRQ